MRLRKSFISILSVLIFITSCLSCSSAKDIEERKNLMMPKKSEMMRNSRYKEVEKRKTNNYKQQKKKKKNKSLF